MWYNVWMAKKKKTFEIRLVSPLITGAAIIAFWRGLWGLMDLYLFPQNEVLSYLVSAFLGILILYLNDFSLEELGS